MLTHVVELLIGRDNPDKDIVVKQYDSGVNLLVLLKTQKKYSKWRSENEPYTPPLDSTAVLKILKPDRKYVTSTITVDSDGLLFPVDAQAFTTTGVLSAEVSIYDAANLRITSATFHIDVEKECISDSEKDSGHFVDIVSEQVRAATEAQIKAEEAAAEAMVSQNAAQLSVERAVAVAISAESASSAAGQSASAAVRAADSAEKSSQAAGSSASKAADSEQSAAAHADRAKKAAEEIESVVGDIESALDGIITLQENLIGGDTV